MLVVSQIAVSLVLLVGALLFVHSFRNFMTVDPGFREKDILIAFVNFEKLKLPSDRYEPFRQDLLEQIRFIPQVESAATSTHVPFNGSWTSGIEYRPIRACFIPGVSFATRNLSLDHATKSW